MLDFELDLLDYLYEKHGGAADIDSWFKSSGYIQAKSGTLSALLQKLMELREPPSGADSVLADMDVTLTSFSAKHVEAS